MTTIKIDVKNCSKCPYMWREKTGSGRSNWYCKHSQKEIVVGIEWDKEKELTVPMWCEKKIN